MSRRDGRREWADLIAAILGADRSSRPRARTGSAADGHHDRRTTTFLRGLTLGAIVGAAIAGSTIWSRWRRDRSSSADSGSARDA